MKIFSLKNFHIEIDALLFAVIPVVIAAGIIDKYITAFSVAFAHEMSHIGMAVFLGGKVKVLKILSVGFNAEIEDKSLSKYEKLIVYSSGPVVNFIIAACLLPADTYYLFNPDNVHFFAWISLYMGVLNILPVLPLDGGKILREILWDRIGIYCTDMVLMRLSIFLAFSVTVLGVIQIYYTSNNFSLLIIGLYVFLTIISVEGEAALMNVKNVVYRHSRLKKKGIYPARDLVVMKWVPLSELIKNMDFDRFHIIHVLDEDLHLIKILTEQEILDGMVKYNQDITFEEFIGLQK